MIIIDEQANGKLVRILRTLPDLEGRFCIHFQLAECGDGEREVQRLIEVAQKKLPDSQAYIDEDQDVFLLTRAVAAKECKLLMFEVARALNVEPADRVGALYDLDMQSGALVRVLQKKEESRSKAAIMRKQQEAQELAAHKRQEILEVGLSGEALNIGGRRKRRAVPELMIIEDDAFSRRLVENVLQKQYRMTWLETAENALATYATLAPDLLFLDINLPDVTGHELLEKIIALDPEAYVIMLSGNADRDNIMQAINCGAKGFVAKPFNRDNLLQYVERCPTIHHKLPQTTC